MEWISAPLKCIQMASGKSWIDGKCLKIFTGTVLLLMVIIGGYNLKILGTAEVLQLNTETGVYEELPALPSGDRFRHRCLLTTVNGEEGIMVTGGMLSDNSNLVEFLLLSTHQWIQLGSLNGEKRYSHGFEIINGRPTVFGGFSPDGKLNSLESYYEEADSWHIIRDVNLTQPAYDFAYVQGDMMYA